MPDVKVYNQTGEQVGTLALSDAVFGAEPKPHLYAEVVKWQLARRRAGTGSTKGRSEIAGANHKPYRQKGTGRARRGSWRKSPVVRGGGVAFGPKSRDWSYPLNKKVRRAALKGALSGRVAEERFYVVEHLALPEYRTKKVLEILGALGLEGALLVDGPNDQLDRSSRNLRKCSFLRCEGVNVYDVLRHDALVISKSAAQALEERLSS